MLSLHLFKILSNVPFDLEIMINYLASVPAVGQFHQMLSLHPATETVLAPGYTFNETQIATVQLLVRQHYLTSTTFRSFVEDF